ncbi:MAG: hydrogenase maturation protease [Anaerolineae bacterium]|nr:hydrogenase maturation protease [Anaerolineae bacterium]
MTRREGRPDVLVLGVGNEALQDEGVGIHVARALAEENLPPNVRVLEGGTAGWALLGSLEGAGRLVLVDAMAMGRAAGTVVTVRPEEIRRIPPAERTSLHAVAITDVLELAEALDLAPAEVLVVGIQPARVAPGLGLSPELQRALPRAVEAVLEAALGAEAEAAPPERSRPAHEATGRGAVGHCQDAHTAGEAGACVTAEGRSR